MAQRVFRQTASGGEIIQLALRLGVLAFLVYWSFVLVRPFIPILVWSMVLTVALYPPYNWLSVHLGDRPRLAAAMPPIEPKWSRRRPAVVRDMPGNDARMFRGVSFRPWSSDRAT